MSPRRRFAMLISGSGSTMDAVLAAIQKKELTDVEPVIVISSDPGAAGLIRAAARGTPIAVIERTLFSSQTDFGEKILDTLRDAGADLVAQLGWLPLTPLNVIEEYLDAIFNQHPGPLDPGNPDFGGRGMFGIHVHTAVIAYQMLTGHRFPTEATTHLVTEEFDRGRIISSAQLDIDLPESPVSPDYFEDPSHAAELKAAAGRLQKELLPIEHQNVINTIRTIVSDKPYAALRQDPLIPQNNIDMLGYAKTLAGLL